MKEPSIVDVPNDKTVAVFSCYMGNLAVDALGICGSCWDYAHTAAKNGI
jgi:hypothetical protein